MTQTSRSNWTGRSGHYIDPGGTTPGLITNPMAGPGLSGEGLGVMVLG